jgi:hypothetical protein
MLSIVDEILLGEVPRETPNLDAREIKSSLEIEITENLDIKLVPE